MVLRSFKILYINRIGGPATMNYSLFQVSKANSLDSIPLILLALVLNLHLATSLDTRDPNFIALRLSSYSEKQ